MCFNDEFLSGNPRYIFVVSHSTILIHGGLGHRPSQVRSWFFWFLIWFSLDLYVSLCAPSGKMLTLGLSCLVLASVSTIPYYDSFMSILSPYLFPKANSTLFAHIPLKNMKVRLQVPGTTGGVPVLPLSLSFFRRFFLQKNYRERYYRG